MNGIALSYFLLAITDCLIVVGSRWCHVRACSLGEWWVIIPMPTSWSKASFKHKQVEVFEGESKTWSIILWVYPISSTIQQQGHRNQHGRCGGCWYIGELVPLLFHIPNCTRNNPRWYIVLGQACMPGTSCIYALQQCLHCSIEVDQPKLVSYYETAGSTTQIHTLFFSLLQLLKRCAKWVIHPECRQLNLLMLKGEIPLLFQSEQLWLDIVQDTR